MAVYLAVFLPAFFCLLSTSTGQSYSKEPCRIYKVSTGEETKQGSVLQGRFVNCVLIGPESGVKFTFDISWALKTLNAGEVDNNALVAVSVLFWCQSPIELDFINPRNTTNKNILLGLAFKGECKVWMQNLVVFAKATDFREMIWEGNKATWSSASAITNLTRHGNNSLASYFKDISGIVAYNSRLENIPSMFTDPKNIWPNMIEIDFRRTPVKRILEQWKTTMPRLQRLYLLHCNLTEPPEFPWNNSTLERYRGLRWAYTSALQLVDVQDNLYPRVLYLDYNNIQDLTYHEFRGFLHLLSLRGNGLRAVGPSCFRSLKGIQTIDLGKNNLASLPQNLFQGLSSLLNIILGSNNLFVIDEKLFKGLNKIRRITLDHNNLHSIPKGVFSSLRSLELLNLAANNITKIEKNPFPEDSALQKLYLGLNKLCSFPSWIFLLRKITLIDLSSNRLTFEDLDKALDDINIPLGDPFEKPPIVLNLSNNNITTLVDYEGLNMIKRDEIISNIRQAKYSYLWKAYVIALSGNPLACDCIMSAVAREIGKLLQTHPSIQSRFETWRCHWPHELRNKSILEIGENQWVRREAQENCPTECTCRKRCSDGVIVVDCEKKNLTEVPSLMPQGLVELNLISNGLRDIPAYPYLVNLTVLKLTNNKVERLKASTVEKLKRVQVLLIGSNNLTTLPREIESLNFTTLALDQNLFKCDCKTKWMKQWLVRNRHRIKNMEKVLCNSEHAVGQAIYSVPDDEFICPTIAEKNVEKTVTIEVIVASTLGGLLGVIVIVAVLLYKYHREVKVFMYTHFNWHPFDRIDDSNPNKIYDAFISYSGSDFEWVVNTLQKRLETHKPPYKLCFHHRDFIIGAPIVANILASVDQSKRMLVVLSSSYAKSDWCLMEFREAHRKVLEDRMNYLIIILFDDVDITELDEEIKAYLRTNTYVSASDKWFWQKLFYAMPLPSGEQSVEDRSLENVAASQDVNNSAVEILQEVEIEMTHNTADTIELVPQ